MNNELVKLYNDELLQLRQQGARFADSHPKIASRLKLGQGAVEDPLVGRLIESTAFLTSKLRYQLQTDNQAIDSDLMQLLYPHYFLPIPACSTVQFSPGDKMDKPYVLTKNTTLKTTVADNNDCTFSTVYPVIIRPVKLHDVSYQREGRIAPKQHAPKVLKSCLTFTLSAANDKATLFNSQLDSVRVFINADLPQANQLRELLLTHTKEILLVSGHKEINIPINAIKPVGFGRDENLLPYLPNSFTGYQLLTEYFAYPEKFMYVNIEGLTDFITQDMQEITLHCFFDEHKDDLASHVSDSVLQLHSTPIINVFEQTGEPIIFDHTQPRYHVIPDKQRSTQAIEVYRIDSLEVNSSTHKNSIDCAPYFGRTAAQRSANYIYWYEQHQPCWQLSDNTLVGDEVFVTLTDVNLEGVTEELSLTPKLLCTNRELANHIPFGGGKPHWQFAKTNHELIGDIRCVRGIQSARYREQAHQRQQVAQHVYINQVGLADNAATLDNLRLVLSHYYQGQSHHQRVIQDGLLSASCEPITIRYPAKLQQGFCRGLSYTLTVDERCFVDNELQLFGSILHAFLTKSCSMNGFVKLTICDKQQGERFTWQPLLGTKPLL